MTDDITVENRNDVPLVAVQVKVATECQREFETFATEVRKRVPRIPFGMFVDLTTIRVFDVSGDPDQIVNLSTLEVLRNYDPDFAGTDSRYGSLPIFHDYLKTLVESWIRDLAFHWKSETPPGSAELLRLELLPRLEGGMTRSHATMEVVR